MAQIRQEINILDHLVTATGFTAPNEFVQLDATQYNGTVSAYLEVVYTNTGTSGTPNIQLSSLPGGAGTVFTTLSLSNSVSAYTLLRGSSFTPSGTNAAYLAINWASGTLSIKSARIVIIQNFTTLTNTETQIEIGNYNLTRTTESAAILTNPKYWKYDASKWDGTTTFYAEAVYDSGSMDTVSVYLYETADILAPSWSAKVTIASAVETTTPTRTRVAFTPVDGRWYTIFSLNGSMDNHDIYRAGVVVQQGTGSFSMKYIDLWLSDAATTTDNVSIEFRSSSITGTVLGTSNSVNGATITSAQMYRFTFATPITLAENTKYYFNLKRSGVRDTTNFIAFYRTSLGDVLANGGSYVKSSGSWGAESSTADHRFIVYDTNTVAKITQDTSTSQSPIYGDGGVNEEAGQSFTTANTEVLTKLEPQYLLANTLFAAGTGLQTFLTDWDSTEWDDGSGSTTYYFQAEAANGSTSDVTLNQADGGGAVTGSTLTNIDNAQISSAMTMPGDENLDVTATTNAGDVAAARILVTYVFTATPATIESWSPQDLIITS